MKMKFALIQLIPILVFVLWLASGLYFGVGGIARANLDETLQMLEKEKETLKKDTINITYHDLTFTNKYELKYFLEAESLEKTFPWAIRISSFVGLILTAFSFGLLGSLIFLIKEVTFEKKTIQEVRIWSMPILGMLTGLVVFGLSYLLPTVLIKSDNELRPITLMFLCLFGGMYSQKFYEKISEYFNKIFI